MTKTINAALLSTAILSGCVQTPPQSLGLSDSPLTYNAPDGSAGHIGGPGNNPIPNGPSLNPDVNSALARINPTSTQIAASAPVSIQVPPAKKVQPAAEIEYFQGSPLVRISVAGKGSFRCILDTGADSLVIPFPVLKHLEEDGLEEGVDWSPIGIIHATLAGGSTTEGVSIKLSWIKIGPWTIKNMPATIMEDGVCLLGMSVLTQFGHPIIDFANQRLILSDEE